MHKRWSKALTSLCFASILFTGCGYYQTGDDQGSVLGNRENKQLVTLQENRNSNTVKNRDQVHSEGMNDQRQTNLDNDITAEVRGWGAPNYYRYSRVNEPNTNIWGMQGGPAVPEWTPEGQRYKVKKAAPYMERERERIQPMGSR